MIILIMQQYHVIRVIDINGVHFHAQCSCKITFSAGVRLGVRYLEKRRKTAMSSKLEYLKKYMSKDDSGGGGKEGKAKKRKKKVKSSKGKSRGNLAILDDDVDWRSLVPESKGESSAEEDDPEDKPIVAEVCPLAWVGALETMLHSLSHWCSSQ